MLKRSKDVRGQKQLPATPGSSGSQHITRSARALQALGRSGVSRPRPLVLCADAAGNLLAEIVADHGYSSSAVSRRGSWAGRRTISWRAAPGAIMG